MSGWSVRSAALLAAAGSTDEVADAVHATARRLAGVLAHIDPPSNPSALGAWAHAQARGIEAIGPSGALREVVALRALAEGLRAAARLYDEVEQGVTAVMHGVAAGADLAAGAGWLTEGAGKPAVREVAPGVTPERLASASDLVALGAGLDGGRVRVLEVARGDGGSAWVVVVPGTQDWHPRAGANPFDVTTDVRAMVGDPTAAAAGVVVALARARSHTDRATDLDPVLLVGHSQGGILAAALASDPAFTAHHDVTHVVTTGAPIGAFPLPPGVQVLSVEHAADPVPALDLTPNPARPSWVTLRTQGSGPPLDVAAHDLHGYVATLAAAEGASLGRLTGIEGVVAWRASAGVFLGGSVRSVREFEVEREWQNPRS